MLTKVLLAASAGLALMPLSPARAWFHGFGGGGFTRGGDFGGWSHSTTFGAGGLSHSSDWGGWDHSTQVGYGGVAHESDYGGAWHGTAATPYGAYHASDYGGYYHASAATPYGAAHTGYYGTTAYGAYYHQPATVNYYGDGGGCWNCGSGAWGAAAAGTAVGLTTGLVAGAAATAAATRPVYSVGVPYAVLPAGCAWQLAYHEYNCNGTWFLPGYGANGIYYTVVPAP